MKETGIIMSGNHPKLILDGIKTMTRRTYGLEKINDMPYLWGEPRYDEEVGMWLFWQQYTGDCIHVKCPYGHIGDRLWVKETWATENQYNHLKPSEIPHTATIYYLANIDYDPFRMGIKRPSLFIPRWASRINLEITGLRAERLQEILPSDCVAEGISPDIEQSGRLTVRDFISPYARLWNSLNAKRGYGWVTNPWVFPISFKKPGREEPIVRFPAPGREEIITKGL